MQGYANWGGLVKELGCLIVTHLSCQANAERERLRVGELCSGMHLRTSLRVQRYDNPPKLH